MCRTNKAPFSPPAMTMLLPGTSQSFSPMFTVCQGLCFHTHGFNCPLHTWMSPQLAPELQNNIFSSLLVVFIWTYWRHVLVTMPKAAVVIFLLKLNFYSPSVGKWPNCFPEALARNRNFCLTGQSQTLLILTNSSVFLTSIPCSSCLSLVLEAIPF